MTPDDHDEMDALINPRMKPWEGRLVDRRNARDKRIAWRGALADRCVPILAALAATAFLANTVAEAVEPETPTMGLLKIKDLTAKEATISGDQAQAATEQTWLAINALVEPLRVDLSNPKDHAHDVRAVSVRTNMGDSVATFLPAGVVEVPDISAIKEPKAYTAKVKHGDLRYDLQANVTADNILTHVSLEKYSVALGDGLSESLEINRTPTGFTIHGSFNDHHTMNRFIMPEDGDACRVIEFTLPPNFDFNIRAGEADNFPGNEDLARINRNVSRLLDEMAKAS